MIKSIILFLAITRLYYFFIYYCKIIYIKLKYKVQLFNYSKLEFFSKIFLFFANI